MTGSKYLSELVDVNMLQKGRLNVIKAPTGSGKTYFALEHIPSLTYDAIHHVVYLIDTINGKEQIIQNYNAISEYYSWSKDVDEDGMWFEPSGKVVVLTYAKFGYLLNRYSDFYTHFSYIICDELPSLLRFQHYSPQPNLHSVARGGLEQAVKGNEAIVIALTATPQSIQESFHAPAVEIPIDQTDLIHYEVKKVVPYNSLDTVLSLIPRGSVGLCYMTRIHQMIDFEQKAREAGFSPVCIWSIGNKEHSMSDEQLAVRDSILNDFTIPPKYDMLIINASSETSLKIKSPVDFVIVHSSNPDTQIQVRGRVNSDLKNLYLPAFETPVIEVPSGYLNTELFQSGRDALVAELNLRNKNNRPYGWPTVKRFIMDNGYTVDEGRRNGCRFSVILPNGSE